MGNIIKFSSYYRKKGRMLMKDIENTRKAEIERRVDEILVQSGVKHLSAVDIVPLVRSHNFLVQTADLPLDTTGYLVVNDKEPVDEDKQYHRLIVVNNKFQNSSSEENIVLKKSRFITAHEFGHFILHKQANEPLYAHRDSGARENQKELEADYFARSILMPRKTLLALNGMVDEATKADETMTEEEKKEFKVHYFSSFFKVTKNKAQKRIGDIEVLASING